MSFPEHGCDREDLEKALTALGIPKGGYELDDQLWEALVDQMDVFARALVVYRVRNVEYRDNWRRMGWRGQLFRIRERAERLWDSLWGQRPVLGDGLTDSLNLDPKLDDAIDLINFAGFLVRAVREGNRDGTWWEGM